MVGALSDDARLSSVCRVYIGPKSGTDRPRKTKIGTEVSRTSRDSDTTLKVKGQLAGGVGILWRPPAQFVLTLRCLQSLSTKPCSKPTKYTVGLVVYPVKKDHYAKFGYYFSYCVRF